MPQYTFLCPECSLQFKRRLTMGAHDSHACPECKQDAPRQWEGQALTHNFAASPGTAQANSGVSQHDYPTADNLVGRSAEMRWSKQWERNQAKSKIREEAGAVALARKDFVENGEGISEYRTLGKVQFEARKALEGRVRQEIKTNGATPSIPDKS